MSTPDAEYPDYGFYELTGFGADIVKNMSLLCDYDVTFVQTKWDSCWDSTTKAIGKPLMDGHFHGCMTYTHTAGMRNRYVEFSSPVLDMNKAGGLITWLDGGAPHVGPKEFDFTGKVIVDVAGWAPTEDGVLFSMNRCKDDEYFFGARIISTPGTYTSISDGKTYNDANDISIAMLLDGKAGNQYTDPKTGDALTVDMVWIYADQAYYFNCDKYPNVASTNDCDLWAKFKTEFAYIHSGLMTHAKNGTTVSLAKKGSGINKILNPCIEEFLKTEEYYKVCEKYGMTKSCFKNDFFPAEDGEATKNIYMLRTDEQTGDCSTGYCKCSV